MGPGTHAGCTAGCGWFHQAVVRASLQWFPGGTRDVQGRPMGKKEPLWRKNAKIIKRSPATVGRPDGDEARSGNLRRLGREDEPPMKKGK